jgi:2-keto-4-pentenoate hydratase/2-oxohepta-3-ene-1,7-dioic acid hydratase in catechol pathway
MKLLRYGEIGREKPGILDANGRIRDLSRVIDDVAGDALGPDGLSRIKALDLGALPLVEGSPRIGAPVGVVPKFLGIGLNYRDHAEETGMPIPEVPIVFAKASSCVSGPYDPVLKPADFDRMDFEVELAVVIGSPRQERRARECPRFRRWLLRLQRRIGAELAEGRRRRMDQGQEL